MQRKMEFFFTLVGASMKTIGAGAHTLQLSKSQRRKLASFLRNKKVCPKCVLLYGLRSVAQPREVRASLKSLLGRMDAVAFSSSGRK